MCSIESVLIIPNAAQYVRYCSSSDSKKSGSVQEGEVKQNPLLSFLEQRET